MKARLSADLDHVLREMARRSPRPRCPVSGTELRSVLARERSSTDL